MGRGSAFGGRGPKGLALAALGGRGNLHVRFQAVDGIEEGHDS